MAIECNAYQTQLTDELLNSLHPEVKDQLIETISNVKFIQRLIDPNRKRAKDLPRDKDGKIIVDILNPHILEDMDYFRPSAKFYEQHGVYTHLRPNPNPTSDYGKWMKQEIERIWYGMVRPSDGEWIPGELYWYLNYTVMKKDIISDDGINADRVDGKLPDVWDGAYLWFHYMHQARKGGIYNNFTGGQHCVQIAKRYCGKSYSIAGVLSRMFVLGDNPQASKGTVGMVMAQDKQKLIVDGTLNKFLSVADHLAVKTEFPSSRIKSTLDGMHWKMGYKDKITGVERGTLNEVFGVAVNDDPSKARGKRTNRLIFEEFGSFRSFLETWNTMRRSVQSGNVTIGTAIAIGTAGDADSSFYGAMNMIYAPETYNIYALPNYYDKGTNGDGKCVFFFGSYLNRPKFMNKDGVSDVTGALIEILQERHKVKYTASDAQTITRVIAEDPITMQESIMRVNSSIYPVTQLVERANEIKANPSLLNDVYYGVFKIGSSGEVEFDPTLGARPILHFPHQDNKLDGCVSIYKMPEKDNAGKVFGNRYILGCDPYDDDTSMTKSLGSIYCLDMWTDRLVASYTGRPQFADEFYEVCRLFTLYYNGVLLYESAKKGIFGYFSRKNGMYLLSDVPYFLRDKDMVKGEIYGNKAHPYDQHVYTPSGVKIWKDISIGDKLFATDGSICTVTGIPFDGLSDIYRIELRDGRTVRATANHLWKVINGNGYEKLLTTEEMAKNVSRKMVSHGKGTKDYNYRIPINNSVEFTKQEVPLDPYFLGLMLGDGSFTGTSTNRAYLTSAVHDMNVYMDYLKYEYTTTDDRHHRIVFPGFKNICTELGLWDKTRENKFIPYIYKYNSSHIRWELLKGLMDSDGTVTTFGTPQFDNMSEALVDGVLWIARSLGINCNKTIYTSCSGTTMYQARLYTTTPVFKLKRKLDKVKESKRKRRDKETSIISIERILKNRPAKCVTVDSSDSCYLIGDFVTTHNSKGCPATVPIQQYGRRELRDWLLKETFITETDKDGVEVVSSIPNLMHIKDPALLEELIQWSPEINTDRHDAVLHAMLLRQEKLKYMEGRSIEDLKGKSKLKGLANDPFFKKNAPSNNKWY
jgi:intein/homing endonuclease